MVQLTDAQLKELRKRRALIAKELPALGRKDQRLHDAMNEPTLSGALRKAVHGSKLPLPEIAKRAAMNLSTLEAFLTADKTLRSDAMDRLANAVSLRLPASAKALKTITCAKLPPNHCYSIFAKD